MVLVVMMVATSGATKGSRTHKPEQNTEGGVAKRALWLYNIHAQGSFGLGRVRNISSVFFRIFPSSFSKLHAFSSSSPCGAFPHTRLCLRVKPGEAT